jgi:putative endonuclease
MWFVYILRCADDALYVGETNELDLRVAKHNEGSASRFTAQRRPVALVHSEAYATRDAALKRERQIKGWVRAKKDALVAATSLCSNNCDDQPPCPFFSRPLRREAYMPANRMT